LKRSGKRSATPLWGFDVPEQSSVAAMLCRRTPKLQSPANARTNPHALFSVTVGDVRRAVCCGSSDHLLKLMRLFTN
jgi:hypothetical protein